MRTLPRATPELLTELARGIVTRDYLVVDDAREWRTSLMLMGEMLSQVTNLGLVLVPVDAHRGSYWLNGRVPACTFTCQMVAREDIDELQSRVDEMYAALYPDE